MPEQQIYGRRHFGCEHLTGEQGKPWAYTELDGGCGGYQARPAGGGSVVLQTAELHASRAHGPTLTHRYTGPNKARRGPCRVVVEAKPQKRGRLRDLVHPVLRQNCQGLPGRHILMHGCGPLNRLVAFADGHLMMVVRRDLRRREFGEINQMELFG